MESRVVVRAARLAVVLEDRDRGILRVDFTEGWSETLAVARDGRETGRQVYVVYAADVLCRWRHGDSPRYARAACARRAA